MIEFLTRISELQFRILFFSSSCIITINNTRRKCILCLRQITSCQIDRNINKSFDGSKIVAYFPSNSQFPRFQLLLLSLYFDFYFQIYWPNVSSNKTTSSFSSIYYVNCLIITVHVIFNHTMHTYLSI